MTVEPPGGDRPLVGVDPRDGQPRRQTQRVGDRGDTGAVDVLLCDGVDGPGDLGERLLSFRG